MVVIQLYWLPYNSIRFYHNICTHIDIILIYVSYRNIPFLYQDPTRQSRNHADGRGRSLARISKDPKEREIWMWQPCANASETWNAECAHSMCDWEPAVFGWSMRLYECLTASFQDLLSLCQCYSRWSAPLPWNVERPSKRVTEEFPTLCKYCTYVWGRYFGTQQIQDVVFCTARDALRCIKMGRCYNQWLAASHAENWEPQQLPFSCNAWWCSMLPSQSRVQSPRDGEPLQSIHAMASFRKLGWSRMLSRTIDLGCNRAIGHCHLEIAVQRSCESAFRGADFHSLLDQL